MYAQPAIKSFLRLLSQQWNVFRVCSASDEIFSMYAQHIMKDDSPRSFSLFPLFPLSSIPLSLLASFVPSLESLYFVSHPMSPVLRLCYLSPLLCPLSQVSIPCLLSTVPSLMSLFLVSWAGIFKKSMGARHRVGIGLLYRPSRLHRLTEFIPCNRFPGSINF